MRSLIVSVLLFVCQPAWAAILESHVTQGEVYANEPVQLVVSINKNETDSPSFKPLEKDFAVQGVSRSTQMTVVNGASDSKTRWTVSLLPKSEGQLTIPALTLSGLKTNPIDIKVRPASELPQSAADNKVFLKVEVKPSTDAYVQQQVLYAVKLYYALPATIANPSLSAPTAKGVEIQQLPGEQHFRVNHDGHDYGVLELHYALFPQTSGKVTIEPPTLTAVDTSHFSGARQNIFNSRQNMVRLSARPVDLEVLPEVPVPNNGWWIPATQLSLTQSITEDLSQVHVGEAITRTITLAGDGVMASQLPDVVLTDDDKFSVYPDKPQLEDRVVSSIIVGSRTQTFAIVPKSSGNVTLPEVRIPWWNVTTRKMEEAVLPEKTIDILPALPGAGLTVPTLPRSDDVVSPVNAAVVQIPKANIWFYVACVIGMLWMITLALWAFVSCRNMRLAGSVRREKKSYAKATLKKSVSAIKKACQQNDPVGAKSAVIAWANVFWPEKKPQGLGGVAALLSCQVFSDQVDVLDSILYKGADQDWKGKDFWAAFQSALKQHALTDDESSEGLPELYS